MPNLFLDDLFVQLQLLISDYSSSLKRASLLSVKNSDKTHIELRCRGLMTKVRARIYCVRLRLANDSMVRSSMRLAVAAVQAFRYQHVTLVFSSSRKFKSFSI